LLERCVVKSDSVTGVMGLSGSLKLNNNTKVISKDSTWKQKRESDRKNSVVKCTVVSDNFLPSSC